MREIAIGGVLVGGSVLGLLGCGRSERPQPAPTPAPAPSDPPKLLQRVRTEAGEASRFSEGTPRRPLWSIRWKSARLDFGERGRFEGVMEEVQGELLEADRAVSRFVAARAEANRADNVLTLSGGVRVTSSRYQATLTADSIVYLPDRKEIRARGNVKVTTPEATLEPGPELVATPDLRTIATPDLFRP